MKPICIKILDDELHLYKTALVDHYFKFLSVFPLPYRLQIQSKTMQVNLILTTCRKAKTRFFF